MQVLRGQKGYSWHKGSFRAPRGVGVLGDIRGVRGVSEDIVGVRGILGIEGSIGTQGPEGYRWQKGALGAPWGVGALRGC